MRRGALVLCLALPLLQGCITAKQWERFRAHGTASTFSVVLGGLAVAIGGMVGLAVAGGGLLGGVMIDQALEPAPEVHVKTVVVQVPPPLPDGTPAKPVVNTYQCESGSLKLPGGFEVPTPAVAWYERLWIALQVVWWVFVAFFILSHAKLRGALLGVLRWSWEAAGRKATALISMLRPKPRP